MGDAPDAPAAEVTDACGAVNPEVDAPDVADELDAGAPGVDGDDLGGAPTDVGAPVADVLDDAPPGAPDADGVGADPRVPWAPPVPAATDATGPVVVGPVTVLGAAGDRVVEGPVGDEVPTGTPGATVRVDVDGAADARADGPPPAARPDGTCPVRPEDDAAPGDAAADATAESAATAATAAEVGATDRRTRAVGSARVPCCWNIRRESVRRTALASGRRAGEGSGWSVDAPTGAPTNSGIGAAAPRASTVVGPRDPSPSEGPLADRRRSVASSVGRTGASPGKAPGTTTARPDAPPTEGPAAAPAPGPDPPPAEGPDAASAPGPDALLTDGPDAASAADRRRSAASGGGRAPPAGPREEAAVVTVPCAAGDAEVVPGGAVRDASVEPEDDAAPGARDALGASAAPRGGTDGGLAAAVSWGEAPASRAGVVASRGERRSPAPVGAGEPVVGAADPVAACERGPEGDAPTGARRIASDGRACPAVDRAVAAARRESAVAVARARRRSSRPEGAGRAAGVVGSVAAEGARSPVTADDARPGPPSFPGRAGGPARGAGVRMTRASDFIVIFPAARTSSETRTGMVVGARRVVLPPGR